MLLLASAALLFSGCGRRIGGETSQEAIEASWSRGQLMTVAATERNRYQNVYTEQIWSAASGTGDMDFEAQLMNQIQSFFTEMTLVCAMAEEEQVELTAQETDTIGRLSREYFAQLTGGDREFLEVSQQEIYELYSAYHRANRMVEEMTSQEDLEISDAQAKVIQVQEIVLLDENKAEEALEALSADGADFDAVLRQYSEKSGGTVSMGRTEEPDKLEEAAFALEQDQISGIVEQDDVYYILKCVNAYDQEATAARKEQMEEEKKDQVFRSLYEPFAAEHQVVYPEGLWESVSFEGGEDCRTDNFLRCTGSIWGAEVKTFTIKAAEK